MSIFGQCDFCGKSKFLTQVIDKLRVKYACQECSGVDPREWAEDEDPEMAREG